MPPNKGGDLNLTTQTTIPSELSEGDRVAFTESLYAVHSDVFAGVSLEKFSAYVVNSAASRTEIQTFHAPNGDLAGYIAIHFFDRTFDGRECVVVRAEAGMLRSYRGANMAGPFMARQLVLNALRDNRETWFMGSLVHPSSFCGLTRHASTFWPNPELSTPPEVLRFMIQLAEDFHLEPVDSARPLVRDVGWVTRDTPSEQAYWRRSTHPLAQFFVEQNPNFHLGNGLVTLVAIGRQDLKEGVWSWGSRTVSRKVDRMGRFFRRVTGTEVLTTEDAVEALAQTTTFSGVSDEALQALVRSGRQVEALAGTTLFSQGDSGDSMYFILSGSVYVLLDSGIGESVVIDQLDRGSLFGELALVTRAPRSATIRLAIDSVLLRIDSTTLATLQASQPELEEVVWGNIGAIRFEQTVRALPDFASLDLTQRRTWWQAGRPLQLGGDSRAIEEAAWLFVQQGTVGVNLDRGPASLSAPSLLAVQPGDVVHSESARIALLPIPAPSQPPTPTPIVAEFG